MATHFPNFSLENKVELHEHGIDGSHGTKKDQLVRVVIVLIGKLKLLREGLSKKIYVESRDLD